MANAHWFKSSCGHDPVGCKNSRDGLCINVVSDCLLYEKLVDDTRNERHIDEECDEKNTEEDT